jgi:hypothetical protein
MNELNSLLEVLEKLYEDNETNNPPITLRDLLNIIKMTIYIIEKRENKIDDVFKDMEQ